VRGGCGFVGDLGWELRRPDGSAFIPYEVFSVCLDQGPVTLDAGGTWRLIVRAPPNSDGTGTYDLAVHAVPAAQTFPIAIGDEVGPGQPAAGAGEIESPGAEDRYTFSAQAGDRVFIDVKSVRGGCGFVGDLGWELRRPDGSAFIPYEVFSVCVDNGPVRLDASGTWRLVVRAPFDDDGTGSYVLRLHSVPAAQTFPIAIGDEVGPGQPAPGAGEIESPGAEDRYTFSGTSGGQVSIDLIEVRGSCGFTSDLGTELLRPDGSVFLPYEIFSICVDRGPVTLDAAGTWTLVVRAPPDNTGTGTYRLALVAGTGGGSGAAGSGRAASLLPAPASAETPVTWVLPAAGDTTAASQSGVAGADQSAGDLSPDPLGGSRMVVEHWMGQALEAVRRRGLTPPRSARVYALVAVAQNDAAVAAAAGGPQAIDAAIEDASRQVLRGLFPDDALRFGDMGVPPATDPGRRAATAALARAAADGSTGRWPGPIPEVRGGWQPTPPMFAWPSDPLAGSWGTWNIASGDAIRVAQPPGPGSARLAREIREIYRLSERLTPRERRIVRRWEARRGTVTPSGLWTQIALELLREERASARQAARVLATLATAQADAMIAAWQVKYRWWTVRPVTEIRRTIDPNWLPFLRTPNFPGYVSGHSTTSAAAATVLGAFLPSHRTRLDAMARQAGRSRLLGGVHIRSDDEAGNRLGAAVGRAAVRRAS
jgi:hypothetical protein